MITHTAYRQKPKYRGSIFEREGRVCQLCGATERLELDHIIPYSISRNSEPDNLRVLCVQCNRAMRSPRKDSRLPLSEWYNQIEAELHSASH